MNYLMLVILACFAGMAHAATYKIEMPLNSMKVQMLNNQRMTFSQLSFAGFETSKTVGSPELPVKTLLVQARPEHINVQVTALSTHVLRNTVPSPVQRQACRCADDKVRAFEFNSQAYALNTAPYVMRYLGAFRGTPVTQVQINLAQYNAQLNQVQVMTEAEINIDKSDFSFQPGEYKDYLIIGPADLVSGSTEFADWKKSQGFNVITETIASPNNTLAAISAIVKNHYTNSGTDFVIILGDEKTVPMFKVRTSGSSQTPTDLKHFTMDGGDDYIPDMFTSRISAANADEVKSIFAKTKEFELKSAANPIGWKKFVGIASNEGDSPSDDEYVKQIADSFIAKMPDATTTHLYQDDKNSKPAYLNSSLSEGAFWLTYLGHGSGTAWASMNVYYNSSDIKGLANQTAVKPVIIDVACMNGNFTNSYLGASFMRAQIGGAPTGAAAYYGGTVNISWHPPAVMSQGIVFEHMDKNFKTLGEALMAGQLYLAGKWASKEDVVDNMEWYHLQGDPGMNIQF